MDPLEFKGLTKWYGSRRGAEEITFSVKAGEVFGYLGPNGSGKTTTLRCAMGFLRATAGEIWIFGERVRAGCATGHRRIGFLPGDFRAWAGMTGKAVLRLLGRIGGRRLDAAREEEVRLRLGLDLGQPIRRLSKGNRQKLGVMVAFQGDPDLLILDEPTASLDPLVRRTVLEMIREAADRGAAVLLSSHDLSEVASACGRAAILREGRLVEIGSVPELAARGEYQIKVRFATATPLFPQDRFPEATLIRQSERELHLSYHGTPGGILRWIAEFPVESLASPEPTLEEAFLDYYRSPAKGRSGG